MGHKCSIGQDSHTFSDSYDRPLILGGVTFEGKSLIANSDGDVVIHALTNAVSGITGVNVLGSIADEMCARGITDSTIYLLEALDLKDTITHISFSIECKTPKITPKIEEMRISIANLTNTNKEQIGITATTGEGLTAFGQGLGIQVFCILSVKQ